MESEERYELTWVGKRKCILESDTPTDKTFVACQEESVNFDTTQNIFVDGDNLDALKLLQDEYRSKIKMIYIDPPYNTGKKFIYNDKFTHSDWLSMMYPRLRLARNLLRDDGVIFVSIDDNEVHNLRRLCDEVFGEENFRNCLLIRRRIKSLNVQFAEKGLQSLNIGFEYVLVYAKSNLLSITPIRMKKLNTSEKGRWDVFWSNADRPTMRYEVLGFTPSSGQWRYSKERADKAIENYQEYLTNFAEKYSLEEYWRITGSKLKFIRRIADGVGKNGGVQHWVSPATTSLRTSVWTDIEVSQIHKEIDLPFNNPKSTELLVELVKLANIGNNEIVFDFFAGSSTTAHAVMKLNAEDGGNRKFIMVQIPEPCDKKSEAFKAGFKTIAEISKERIRRAGKKILEGDCHESWNKDIGFRVYKIFF